MPEPDLTDAELQRAAGTASDVADRLRGVGEPLAEAVVASAQAVARRLQTPVQTRAATSSRDMSEQDNQITDIEPQTDDAATPEEELDSEVDAIPAGGPITAKPNKFFNGKWIVFGLLLLAGGAWFAYDGFVKYPTENARIDELEMLANQAKLELDIDKESEYRLELKEIGDRHSDNDLRFQILLAFLLPIGGLALIGWTLWTSRGVIRLDEDDTLHIAGHPPVPLSAVTDIDNDRWDKKGVCRLAYDHAGKTGVIKLDDFIFDRPPTDKIHDRAVWVHKQSLGA